MTPSRASADGSPGTPSILGTAAVEQGALLVTDAGHRGPRSEGSRAAPRGGSEQRGSAYKLAKGRWGLRYRDADGSRCHTADRFPNKTAALRHYRDVIEPTLTGGAPIRRRVTLAQLVELYLERQAVKVRPCTIATLRARLKYALDAHGDVPLSELARMADELADWQLGLPDRSRCGIVQALRQTLGAGVRWGYMTRNPARLAGSNPAPSPRPVRAYTFAELDALAAELSARYRPLPVLSPRPGSDPRSGRR